MAAASHCLASGRHVVGSIGLPFQEGIPGDTRGIRRSLSEPTTLSLLKACETNNLKPLSAVHASLAAANFSGSKFVDGHYTSNMRFSLQPYLREPFNSARYAAGLYTGSYMAKVDHGMSWQDIAAQYNKLYDAGLRHEFLIARRQFAIQALNMMQSGEPSGRNPLVRSELDISSVDNAENLVSPYHRGRGGHQLRLEVREISLGIECLAKESYLFV
ncbi:hypothetical protein VSDG_09841 [Cytospora chrysosperma]|uniref:Uncharacterized protein n=1 Tax=Cytospora chrysosperma TaxID=252740 RepID=A0A423V9B3_CYTCH|nr:hypothetical protein VSDG_09841 [Valsa sordida]